MEDSIPKGPKTTRLFYKIAVELHVLSKIFGLIFVVNYTEHSQEPNSI